MQSKQISITGTRARLGFCANAVRALGLIVLGCWPSDGHPAEITSVSGGEGIDFIQVKGVLNEGDDQIFRKVAARSDKAIVVLDSEGGAVKVGIEIGRAIKLRGFATVVAPETLCASACALTWLAGSPRVMDASSRVGFHAAYRVVEGKASESGVGNALVGAYLNQMGLPDSAVAYVTSAPPEGIDWLTPTKANAVGITFDVLKSEPAVTPPTAATPSDPLSTVVAFYSALSAADGETAAALVVPEKRGKGPFSEEGIRGFYGSMSQPLTVRSATRLPEGGVRVAYSYTTVGGRTCMGRADVDVVQQYSRFLISRIKALDGC